jgi:hypothetical protein
LHRLRKQNMYARLLLLIEIHGFKIKIRVDISTNFGALTRRSYVVRHECWSSVLFKCIVLLTSANITVTEKDVAIK